MKVPVAEIGKANSKKLNKGIQIATGVLVRLVVMMTCLPPMVLVPSWRSLRYHSLFGQNVRFAEATDNYSP